MILLSPQPSHQTLSFKPQHKTHYINVLHLFIFQVKRLIVKGLPVSMCVSVWLCKLFYFKKFSGSTLTIFLNLCILTGHNK